MTLVNLPRELWINVILPLVGLGDIDKALFHTSRAFAELCEAFCKQQCGVLRIVPPRRPRASTPFARALANGDFVYRACLVTRSCAQCRAFGESKRVALFGVRRIHGRGLAVLACWLCRNCLMQPQVQLKLQKDNEYVVDNESQCGRHQLRRTNKRRR